MNPKYIEVFISGQVEDPGRKRVSKRTALNEAIFLAGGKKILTGKINFVRINSNGSYEKRKFSFSPNASRDSYKNPLLKNGDFIIVGRGSLSKISDAVNQFTSPFVGIYSAKRLFEIFD